MSGGICGKWIPILWDAPGATWFPSQSKIQLEILNQGVTLAWVILTNYMWIDDDGGRVIVRKVVDFERQLVESDSP